MIKFSKDKILLLHQLIAEESGGSIGVRDEKLLESALESAFASFEGNDLYRTKEEKAAKIGYSLISNHAFLDGNKRIGVSVMASFLEMNGIKLLYEDDELINVGLSVADGTMKYEDLLQWINDHKVYK
ncbi:MAG: type II toxin-antitoxin system death-on-curing family toxin [Lachnospiraceae bacterium]|nr:type II toxin-antitoxin system death-on-curing family toxin [Lachnospiraceae bacterium]